MFAGQCPDLTFETLGLPPWVAHAVVGDKIWFQLWGRPKGDKISPQHWVPRQLLGILQFAVPQLITQLTRLAAPDPDPDAAARAEREAAALARAAALERLCAAQQNQALLGYGPNSEIMGKVISSAKCWSPY